MVWASLRLAIGPDFASKSGMTASLPKSEKLYSVQALRGLAAFLVLLYHAVDVQKKTLLSPDTAEYALLSGFWDQGYAGVDLFFVISGFIMVYVTRDIVPGARSILRFLYSRATRIYPLWWVFAGVMMLYYIVSYGQPAAPDVAAGDAVGPYIAKSLALFPQQGLPVLGVGWTLIHEMWFYIAFAGLLLLPRKALPLALAIWAAGIVLVSLLYPVTNHAANLSQLIRSPLTLEFILGAGAALLILKRPAVAPKPVFIFGVLLGITALWIGLKGGPNFVWHRVLAFGVPGAFLVYGAVALERAGNLSVPHWAVRLGDWSYSLYLSHFLVLLALRRGWQSLTVPEALSFTGAGPWDNLAFAAIGIFLSILVAGISYRVIEKPLLIGSRKLWKPASA